MACHVIGPVCCLSVCLSREMKRKFNEQEMISKATRPRARAALIHCNRGHFFLSPPPFIARRVRGLPHPRTFCRLWSNQAFQIGTSCI